MTSVKCFLAEELTEEVWRRYGRLAGDADRCWALKLFEGKAALRALDDPRWCRETVIQMESVEANLGRWANALARSQTWKGNPLSPKEQALLAYGIEARLWPAAMAESCLQYMREETACDGRNLEIRLVASNPYLRDWARTRCGSALTGIERLPASRPVLQAVRERMVGSVWLRRLSLRRQRTAGWGAGSTKHDQDPRRTAAAFILNQRYLDLFQPIRQELEARGWAVPVYAYNPLIRPYPSAVSFSEAAARTAPVFSGDLEKPVWMISDEIMTRCPVSQAWLRRALDASWVTARALVAQHLRLLAALRPAVVLSFGPEIMSLSLQAAAERLDIPSLFLNHTFREPARSCWYLQATASTMAGPHCVELNRRDLEGRERRGMVATGHPPYDALLERSTKLGGNRAELSNLSAPPERPYVILALALWSNNLLWHAMQRKALQMLADALPSDAFLICKIHPSWEDRELPAAVLGAKLPKEAFRVVGESEYQTPDLLAACHVAVIHEQSMSLSDAVVMGRPTIAIAHPEVPYGRYCMNHPAWGYKGAWRVVSDAAELRQALVTLTRDNDARAALLKHRRAYIDRFLVAADGQSSRRVADLAEHIASGEDTGSFVAQVGPGLIGES
jgi:hypothetical protein